MRADELGAKKKLWILALILLTALPSVLAQTTNCNLTSDFFTVCHISDFASNCNCSGPNRFYIVNASAFNVSEPRWTLHPLEDSFVSSRGYAYCPPAGEYCKNSSQWNFEYLEAAELSRLYSNRIWLKFKKEGIDYCDEAYVCLYKNESAYLGDEGDNFYLYYSHNQTWSEKALTWESQPDWVEAYVDVKNLTSENKLWVCWDVSEAFCDSKESNASYLIRPKIEELEEITVTENFTIGEGETPSWDLYINESNPDKSYNESKLMFVMNKSLMNLYYTANPYSTYFSIIKIAPDSIYFPGSDVSNAMLYLYLQEGCAQSGTIGVFELAEANNTEDVTWNKKPETLDVSPLIAFDASTSGWKTIDITTAAREAALKGGYGSSNITLGFTTASTKELNEDEFADAGTTVDASFSSEGNITVNITLPRWSEIEKAEFRLTGLEDDNCQLVTIADPDLADASSSSSFPVGITMNETYIWILRDRPYGIVNDTIERYYHDGTYISRVTIGDYYSASLHFNGTHFFVGTEDKIYVYDEAGNKETEEHSHPSIGAYGGLDFNGTHFFIADYTNESVFAWKFGEDPVKLGEAIYDNYDQGIALQNNSDKIGDNERIWLCGAGYAGVNLKRAYKDKGWDGRSFADGKPSARGLEFNGTHFFIIHSVDSNPKNEMVIARYDCSFPQYPYVDIGGDGDVDWDFRDVNYFMNSTLTGDITDELQNYLLSQPEETDFVTIPIVIHSGSKGKIRLSNLTITYLLPFCFRTEEFGSDYAPRIEITYSYPSKQAVARFISKDYENSTLWPRLIANISWGINATSKSGTFEPFGQTETQWIWKVCAKPEASGPIDIYLKLTDIKNSTGHSLSELPSCIKSFYHWSNATNVESPSEANITGNVAKRILYNLQNGTCGYVWENITFEDCTPGDYFTFNFTFVGKTDSD